MEGDTINLDEGKLGVLERLKLTSELGTSLKQLDGLDQSPSAVLQRLKLASRIREILLMLGGNVDKLGPSDEELSDDPSDPNYRWKDTGYIPDSRKERALQMIRLAKENGTALRATDIDWEAVEKNPRQAKDLIVKSNLFGKVDWAAHREAGMTPGAAFLIDRIYASIASAPAEDSPQARKDYALGLETIRTRLEPCKTIDAVLEVLDDIKDERAGELLNVEETQRYEAIRELFAESVRRTQAIDGKRNDAYRQMNSLYGKAIEAKHEVSKRQARGWTVSAELLRIAADAAAAHKAAEEAWQTIIADTRADIDAARAESQRLHQERVNLVEEVRQRNRAQNPLVRAWATFGPRFDAVLQYRSRRSGSDAFMSHVVNAKTGKFDDWAWAEKDKVVVDRATKQEISFQLIVADHYERKGGKEIKAESTAAMKAQFGFRDVQSGNWVLNDPNSAKFHVEQTVGAMSDLADIVGIDAAALGLGGRLAMAFGARGRGGKNAARAHYEPVQRVINLTKMGGGGCLAHEYFHALDNLLGELQAGKASGVRDYFTTNPNVLAEGPLRDAARGVRDALLTGGKRAPQTISFGDKELRLAKLNLEKPSHNLARSVKEAPDVTAAVLAVDAYFEGRQEGSKNHRTWRKLAAAFHAPAGSLEVTAFTGPKVSSYAVESAKLDGQEIGKYWSKTVELAARAFQAYTEDRLKGQDRRNDYLSSGANNGLYAAMGVKPFPEGEERERINAAFDTFFAELRKAKVMEDAAGNKTLMDSIFGAEEGNDLSDDEVRLDAAADVEWTETEEFFGSGKKKALSAGGRTYIFDPNQKLWYVKRGEKWSSVTANRVPQKVRDGLGNQKDTIPFSVDLSPPKGKPEGSGGHSVEDQPRDEIGRWTDKPAST